MTAPFPHRYETALAWTGESRGVLSAPPRPDLPGGPPPEFGGRATDWSPEHLLLASANLCLMATFMAIGGKNGLKVLEYSSVARGTLDNGLDGVAFTEVLIKVKVRVPQGEEAKAGRTLEAAKRHCIVSNSLRRHVEVELETLPEVPA